MAIPITSRLPLLVFNPSLSMHFFSTVEFYVIITIVAAAIIAISCRPISKGPAYEKLLGSNLEESDDYIPSIRLQCLADGKIILTRFGIDSLNSDGAASIAIKKIGTDVLIEERLVTGKGVHIPCLKATFIIDFMPFGKYHLRYNSNSTGLFCAFPFTVKPDMIVTKHLKR